MIFDETRSRSAEALKLLGLEPIQKNIVVRIQPYHGPNLGTTNKVGDLYYIDLFIPSKNADYGKAIEAFIHELVHVQQMHSGRLSWTGSQWAWTGDFYAGSEEPWEDEAVKISNEIIRQLQ